MAVCVRWESWWKKGATEQLASSCEKTGKEELVTCVCIALRKQIRTSDWASPALISLWSFQPISFLLYTRRPTMPGKSPHHLNRQDGEKRNCPKSSTRQHAYNQNSQTFCSLNQHQVLILTPDGRNIHILRYGEVFLAYTWFGLNVMLTRTACLMARQTCLVYLF